MSFFTLALKSITCLAELLVKQSNKLQKDCIILISEH